MALWFVTATIVRTIKIKHIPFKDICNHKWTVNFPFLSHHIRHAASRGKARGRLQIIFKNSTTVRIQWCKTFEVKNPFVIFHSQISDIFSWKFNSPVNHFNFYNLCWRKPWYEIPRAWSYCNELQADSSEWQAESNEQRAQSNKQHAKPNEQQTVTNNE